MQSPADSALPPSSAHLFERQPLDRQRARPTANSVPQAQPSPSSSEVLLKGGGFSNVPLKRMNSDEAAAELMSTLSTLSSLASRGEESATPKQPAFHLDLTQPPLAAPSAFNGPPTIPTIPNFHRVRSSDEATAVSGCATAGLPAMPAIPKIPNFARALSSGSSHSPSKPPKSGSSSAREATGLRAPADELELRRPLTARSAHSLGVTTPRGTAMRGPVPMEKSMRGMEGVLAESALITPRPSEGRGFADGGATPRTPRTPRGSGVLSARRRGDDCVVAPPPRSPRGGGGGPMPMPRRGGDDTVARRGGHGGATMAAGGGGARSTFGGAWLDAALEATCGDAATWLRHATGATVVCTAGAAAVDVSDGGAGRDGGFDTGGAAVGVVVGPVSGSKGGLWHVRFPGRGAPVTVPAERLHRVPPAKGERACAVLGAGIDVAGPQVVGVVLSVENGVAVLRSEEVATTAAKQVRVLPIDALCRLEGAGEQQ